MNKKILCTICARGGSKGLKNKNIIKIKKKPLIAYSIEHALRSNLFNKIVLSSDSNEIISVANNYEIETFFKRNKKLAGDKAGKLDVIRDALLRSERFFNFKFDYVIDLDVTSPLRDVSDIKKAFKQFLKDDNDNLFSVTHAKKNPYFNLIQKDSSGKIELVKKLQKPFLRRQDAPACYEMNASIYIWKRDILLNNNSLFLNKTGIYIMPEERSIDIDSKFDFQIVEYLLSN